MTASCGRTNNSCLPGYVFINRGQRLEKAENSDLIKFILKDLEQDPQYEKKKCAFGIICRFCAHTQFTFAGYKRKMYNVSFLRSMKTRVESNHFMNILVMFIYGTICYLSFIALQSRLSLCVCIILLSSTRLQPLCGRHCVLSVLSHCVFTHARYLMNLKQFE